MLSVLLIAATAVRPGAASARAFARLRLDATCHVGPHKTGSTTIQDAILGEWRDSLVEEDGFDIPPRPAVHARRTAHDARRSVAYARAAFALRTAARLGASEPWRWLVEHIRSAAAAGKRLVITAEGLSLLRGSRAGIVPRVLLSAGYAPKVVIVYRRLFERIPSWHSERWLKHAVPVRRYAPIVDWVAANGTRETAPKNLYGQTVALRDVYVALGLEVFVLNMHAIPNGSSLVRGSLRSAPSFCAVAAFGQRPACDPPSIPSPRRRANLSASTCALSARARVCLRHTVSADQAQSARTPTRETQPTFLTWPTRRRQATACAGD